MASPSAVLSILVEASTGRASASLAMVQRQLSTTDSHVGRLQSSNSRLSKSFDESGRGAMRARAGFGSLASGVIAAGGAFAAFEAAKGAIRDTTELTAATIKLSAATGMDTKTASLWIESMKVRGVQSSAVAMSFITLEKNIRNATNGSKSATLAFHQLGIPVRDLKSQNLQATILQIADAFQKMHNPAQRAAIAQQLFGRNAKAMIPILAQGRRGVQDMLATAQRYGAYLPKNIKQFREAHEAQLALNLAMDGMKIAFTQAVLPFLVAGAQKLMTFIGQMRTGKGVGGEVAAALSKAFGVIKTVVGAAIGALGGLKNVLLAVGIAFAAIKIGSFISALAGILSNPYTAVFAAIAAAALLIIKNWKVVGPFFRKLWADIKQPLITVGTAVIHVWEGIYGSLKALWQKISGIFSGAGGGKGRGIDWKKVLGDVAGAVAWAVTALGNAIKWIIGALTTAMPTIIGIVKVAVAAVKGVIAGVSAAIGFLKPIIQSIISLFAPVVAALISGVRSLIPVIGPAFSAIGNIIRVTFNVAKAVMSPFIDVIGVIARRVIPQLVAAFRVAWNVIKVVMNAIAGVIRGAFQVIKGIIQVFTGLFTLDFGKMWTGVKTIFSGGVQALVSIVKGIWGAMKAVVEGLVSVIESAISSSWHVVTSVFSTVVNGLVTIVSGIFNGMYDAGKFIIEGLLNGIKSIVNFVGGAVVGLINAIIDVLDVIPGVSIGHVGWSGFAEGGMYKGQQAAQTGMVVKMPGYFAGEEAPRHPEVIIATNPAYRSRNLGLWAQAGRMLGIPGFAAGGFPTTGGSGASHTAIVAPPKVTPQQAAIKKAQAIGQGGFISALISRLPSPISLPSPFDGLPSFLLGKATDFINSSVGGFFSNLNATPLNILTGFMSAIGLRKGGVYAGAHFAKGGVYSTAPVIAKARGHEKADSGIPGWAASWQARYTHMPGPPTVRVPGISTLVPNNQKHLDRLNTTVSSLKGQLDATQHELDSLSSFYQLDDAPVVNAETGQVDKTVLNRKLGQQNQLVTLQSQIFRMWWDLVVLYNRQLQANKIMYDRIKRGLQSIHLHGLKGKRLDAAKSRQQNTSTLLGKYAGYVTTSGQSLHDAASSRDAAWISLAQLIKDRGALAGTRSSTGTDTLAVLQALTTNLTAQATQAQQALAVQTGQFSTLQNATGLFQGPFARGGKLARSGWALVGENGPELAQLPGGTRIIPNDQLASNNTRPILVQVVVEDGAVDTSKIRVIADREARVVTRRAARLASRGLPGRGGQ